VGITLKLKAIWSSDMNFVSVSFFLVSFPMLSPSTIFILEGN